MWKSAIEIMTVEDLDYLKLNFNEVYGNNTQQWAFMNLDSETREEYYGNRPKSEQMIPYVDSHQLKYASDNKTLYSLANVHYCNWPLMFSKKGNRKIFIEGDQHKLEQLWMRKTFALQKQGKLKCGTLLENFNHHNRLYYYDGNIRKEN